MSQSWYAELNDQRIGPIPGRELAERALSGEITPETLVSRDGRVWLPATRVRGLVFRVDQDEVATAAGDPYKTTPFPGPAPLPPVETPSEPTPAEAVFLEDPPTVALSQLSVPVALSAQEYSDEDEPEDDPDPRGESEPFWSSTWVLVLALILCFVGGFVAVWILGRLIFGG